MNRLSGITVVLAFMLPCITLKAQTNIAIVEFTGNGISVVEASALTDRLRTELFLTGKFKVIESRYDGVGPA